MNEQERIEGARRARAAVAYAGLKANELAAAIHASPATTGRILSGTRKETTHDELWKIADACTLPREWFSADFSRLSEVVPAGQPTFGEPGDLAERMEQELAAHVERVRQRTEAAAKGKRGPRRKVQKS
jgi:transcriptional regulator with XRE-family HTH domain